MSDRPGKTRWALGLLGAGAAVGILLVLWLKRAPAPPPSPDEAFPLPPYSPSRFLNTGPEARYIGVAACSECHREEHQSYLLTAHSRALGDVDPATEPPDGAFEHAPSGRSYRVYRADGQLRHEEVVRTAAGAEVARVDLPVRYGIGSGHSARSYLVEVDGFLHESPITWYAGKNKWGTSPGYDDATHPGFERSVGVGCLSCHAGRVEESGVGVDRLTFHEKAIGCENCHGPGSLHREFHRAGKRLAGEEDLTIVHPGKLSRSLQEDVCAACHLGDAAAVPVRGRRPNDFRPGTPLSDYRTHYHVEGGDERMTVVGHAEQLRLSACYQKSETLTCLTCHDPHRPVAPGDRTAFHRQKCLDCHETRPCSVDRAERVKQEPRDDCTACHMPRGDTEVPHVAFTHHRIGRHPPQRPPAPGGEASLVPTGDVSRLGPLDRQRNLGLAYRDASQKPAYAQNAAAFWERAKTNLDAAYVGGLRDPEMLAALAEISWYLHDRPRTRAYARELLGVNGLAPQGRAPALILLADCDFEDRDFESAVALLTELVSLRRCADDWRLLGLSYLEQRQPAKALAALQEALAIRPTRPATHSALAEAYRRLGDPRRAGEHLEKAQWLSQHGQD